MPKNALQATCEDARGSKRTFYVMVRSALAAMGVVALAVIAWANWPSEAIHEGVRADLVVVRLLLGVLKWLGQLWPDRVSLVFGCQIFERR